MQDHAKTEAVPGGRGGRGAPETAVGVPQVELYGSRQLYMAGHRGVISYSTEEVTVSGGSMTVRIIGKDLQLAAMTDGELRLTGHIDRVELME